MNATILPQITLKQRPVTPEAAGSSPVTPATHFLNNYNTLRALSLNRLGAFFAFVQVFVQVFLSDPLKQLTETVILMV